jgi:L-alanine-DL-glutamate epimerase-like enolase superfamily enzyme
MDCEVHGNGAANLAVVAAIKNCRWYERGLLHPFVAYDEVPGYLRALAGPMDKDGLVHLSQTLGLGEDIDFDFIREHTVRTR